MLLTKGDVDASPKRTTHMRRRYSERTVGTSEASPIPSNAGAGSSLMGILFNYDSLFTCEGSGKVSGSRFTSNCTNLFKYHLKQFSFDDGRLKIKKVYSYNYVLDGQQRLTSIYGVLNYPEITKQHSLNVYFDLKNEKFIHYKGTNTDYEFPMGYLFNTAKIIEYKAHLKTLEDSDKLQENFDILYETFREYLIPVVTIHEKTVEDVCPIFERINSTGTKLNIFDLMVAATWSEGFDLNDQVAMIKESTKLKDFEITNT